MTPNKPASNNSAPKLELDDRFPSCRWIGFWLQPPIEGRQQTELLLTFSEGVMTGTGYDWVGEFAIKGQYSVETGVCHWIKRYVGSHSVVYHGYNEGKGIWGMWEIRHPFLQLALMRGGFHIWPETMADPTQQHTAEEAGCPISDEQQSPALEPALSLSVPSHPRCWCRHRKPAIILRKALRGRLGDGDRRSRPTAYDLVRRCDLPFHCRQRTTT